MAGVDTTLVRVSSSNVQAIGWTPWMGANILEVQFHSGALYQYYFVPESVFQSMLRASSKGRYLHWNIKKPGYPYVRLR